MGLFKDILKDDESLIKNDMALDFSFQPKIIKHREDEQREIAFAIKPLFQKKTGKNIFIHGKPGIGKTLVSKKVLDEINEEFIQLGEDETEDDIETLYVNCWQKNTSYKVIVELCELVGYRFTQNKKTDELMKKVANILNKKSVVFVFDEVDKLEDLDFLYTLIETIYRKSIIMITNYKQWILNLDERIKSRIAADIIEIKPYGASETRDILVQRRELAFFENIWAQDAFDKVVETTVEYEDIRTGMHLMKESAFAAEMRSSRNITLEHVEKSVSKIAELNVKNKEELTDEEKFILAIIKKTTGEKIGTLYKMYQDEQGKASYKTFQRKIKKLSDNKFISAKKVQGGPEGSTTYISYLKTKKLTDF